MKFIDPFSKLLYLTIWTFKNSNSIYSGHLYKELNSRHGSMKKKQLQIFQSAQENFIVLGLGTIHSKQIFENQWKIVVVNLIFIAYITFICVYLFHVAKNFKECTEAIFLVISAINCFLSYLFFIWKINEWFETIVCLEEIVQKSMHKLYASSWKQTVESQKMK